MLTLTDSQLDWLAERVPDPPRSPLGGRPAADKRTIIQGIFWILDNGAKWKDLPSEFGSKSTVHRWFQRWVREGVFEAIMRDAGHVVEERGQYKLYECFIDGTFSKARGGGDGIGCTRVGKGVKIMVLVDARGLPVAVDTMSPLPMSARWFRAFLTLCSLKRCPNESLVTRRTTVIIWTKPWLKKVWR